MKKTSRTQPDEARPGEVQGYVEQAFLEPVGGKGRAKKLACHVFFADAQGQRIENTDAYTDDPRIETAIYCALSRPLLDRSVERLRVRAEFEEIEEYRIITRFDVFRSTAPSGEGAARKR